MKFPTPVTRELQKYQGDEAAKNKQTPSMMVSQNGHNLNCLQQKRIRHTCSCCPPRRIELSNLTDLSVDRNTHSMLHSCNACLHMS